ncbi:hypothetical protein Tco_1177356 [Tanacetum coccineum]
MKDLKDKGGIPVACHMFTYTLKDCSEIWWIGQKAVATNGAPTDQKEGFEKFNKGFSWDNNKERKKNRDRFSPYKGSNHGLLENLSKSAREILSTEKAAKAFKQPPRMEQRHQIEEAVKSGQLAHLVKGIKKGKAKASDTLLGEWKKGDKDIVLAEAPILMVNREGHTSKRKYTEESVKRIREITFPLVLRRAFMASRRGPSSSYCEGKSLHKNGNPELCYRQIVVIGKQLPTSFKRKLQDLLRSNTDVFTWTYADLTMIPKTIMVGR